MSEAPVTARVDPVIADILRDIIDDPSLPVGDPPANDPQLRVARVREALDHIASTRVAAVFTEQEAADLQATAGSVSADLATVLAGHAAAAIFVTSVDPSPSRNAVLGDIARGDIAAFSVESQVFWIDGVAPGPDEPLGHFSGTFVTAVHPSLIDLVLVRHHESGSVIALPPHRLGLTWSAQAADPDVVIGPWAFTADAVSVHIDEVIAVPSSSRPGPFITTQEA